MKSARQFGDDRRNKAAYSAGTSKLILRRNQFVFHAPYTIPSTSHEPPHTFDSTSRCHHNHPQIANPSSGTTAWLHRFSRARTKYRRNDAAFTPINPISAPKLSRFAPRS